MRELENFYFIEFLRSLLRKIVKSSSLSDSSNCYGAR